MSEQISVVDKARAYAIGATDPGYGETRNMVRDLLIELSNAERELDRLRPAPATEADAEDGWEVVAFDGSWHAVYRYTTYPEREFLSPHGDIIDHEAWINHAYVNTLFATKASALAALAKWREKNRKFTPTPANPIEGVTLFDACLPDKQGGGTVEIFVDDVFAGDLHDERGIWVGKTQHEMEFEHPVAGDRYAKHTPALAAFRDRIRAERNKPATKDEPRTWTRAEIISICESVK